MTASFLAYLSTYETRQNILVKLGGLTLGISKVFQISSKSSHKIQLILAFLTVLFTFLYLLWGTRTGICCIFVYLLFLGIPWEYWVILYTVGKVWMRRLQCRWNREKWCRWENWSFRGGTTLHNSQGAEYVDGKGTGQMNLGGDEG